jgi:hypothetical protein
MDIDMYRDMDMNMGMAMDVDMNMDMNVRMSSVEPTGKWELCQDIGPGMSFKNGLLNQT